MILIRAHSYVTATNGPVCHLQFHWPLIPIFIVREVWREEARGRSKVMIGRLMDYEYS